MKRFNAEKIESGSKRFLRKIARAKAQHELRREMVENTNEFNIPGDIKSQLADLVVIQGTGALHVRSTRAAK